MANSFIKWFFISTVMGMLFVVSVIYFIDPFGVHSSFVIKGINHHKYEIQGRLSTAFNMIKFQPKNILLGTSRTLVGFDNEALKSLDEGEDFYNAGFAGASFDEIYSYFLHALYVQPDLKKVILGIDLLSFNNNRKPQKDFNEARLQKKHYSLKDLKDVLFSYHALSSSFQTFAVSAFDYGTKNSIVEMGELNYLRAMLKSDENYGNYKLDSIKIRKFEELVAICNEKRIELKVFICPIKALYADFYFQNGLWSSFEELKRQLCFLHPLWDFSGFNAITTESLNSECSLYHECSHFTSFTGRLLLDRMHNKTCIIDSVGFLLTPKNIKDALIKIRKDHVEWLEKQNK